MQFCEDALSTKEKREIKIIIKSLFSICYVLAVAIDFGWYWL
jgi:hypothetical protein